MLRYLKSYVNYCRNAASSVLWVKPLALYKKKKYKEIIITDLQKK